MSTRRITFEKQQRERAKKEKAALKRERRQQRKADRVPQTEEEFEVLDGPPEPEPFDPELA